MIAKGKVHKFGDNVDTDVIILTTGKVYQAQPFPPFIQNIIKNGGLMKSIG